MENIKEKVEIITLHQFGSSEFKIAKLKFYNGSIPSIGMSLRSSGMNLYVISGIVFESGSNGIWDCKLKDELDELKVGNILTLD